MDYPFVHPTDIHWVMDDDGYIGRRSLRRKHEHESVTAEIFERLNALEAERSEDKKTIATLTILVKNLEEEKLDVLTKCDEKNATFQTKLREETTKTLLSFQNYWTLMQMQSLQVIRNEEKADSTQKLNYALEALKKSQINYEVTKSIIGPQIEMFKRQRVDLPENGK